MVLQNSNGKVVFSSNLVLGSLSILKKYYLQNLLKKLLQQLQIHKFSLPKRKVEKLSGTQSESGAELHFFDLHVP